MYFKLFSLFSFFVSIANLSALDLTSLPDPYRNVSLMPFNPHGWYQNADEVEYLIKKHSVKTIIEVGSWLGASTRHMGSLLPEEDGILFAVDTWLGSPNEDGDLKVLETLYDQFLSNVIHVNLCHKIIPIRMDSLKAADKMTTIADFIYIDATHLYDECLADCRAWYPHVKEGGIFCGDDWDWGTGGVEKAVRQFCKENDLEVRTNGLFWYIIKP